MADVLMTSPEMIINLSTDVFHHVIIYESDGAIQEKISGLLEASSLSLFKLSSEKFPLGVYDDNAPNIDPQYPVQDVNAISEYRIIMRHRFLDCSEEPGCILRYCSATLADTVIMVDSASMDVDLLLSPDVGVILACNLVRLILKVVLFESSHHKHYTYEQCVCRTILTRTGKTS